MKRIYKSPQSKMVALEDANHILDTTQEPDPTPSGEGVPDDAKAFRWVEGYEEDVEEGDYEENDNSLF